MRAVSVDCQVDGPCAEYERRHRERQHQQPEQQTAPPQSQCEGRTDGAECAQDAGAEAQRQHDRAVRTRRHAERDCDERREQHERQTTDCPMCKALGEGKDRDRLSGQEHLLERPVGMVGAEQELQPKQ